MADVVAPVLDWYDAHARDLPWREPGTSPWAVLVSEVMLQQTPVRRVIPAYRAWTSRWPTAPALAASSRADAVRAWDTLGYPRRALRLHQAAEVITDRHAGEVPRDLGELLALPGVGSYTARAVAAFAHGARHPVVDTNVRRVVSRAVAGSPGVGPPSTQRDLRAVEPLLPQDDATAVRFSAALMELGAVVCTARPAPRCDACPLRAQCRWRAAGFPGPPPGTAGPRASRPWAGSDRQARGRLLAALRAEPGAVALDQLAEAWPDPAQRARALTSLVADRLVDVVGDRQVALAGSGLGDVTSRTSSRARRR